MEAIEAIHSRRTIRVYRPDPVDRAVLEQVLWAAVQAPTPPVSGPSTWKLCVIEGVERLATYGARAKQYAFEHQPPNQRWGWTERPDFKVFWRAPTGGALLRESNEPGGTIRLLPRSAKHADRGSRARTGDVLGRSADSLANQHRSCRGTRHSRWRPSLGCDSARVCSWKNRSANLGPTLKFATASSGDAFVNRWEHRGCCGRWRTSWSFFGAPRSCRTCQRGRPQNESGCCRGSQRGSTKLG